MSDLNGFIGLFPISKTIKWELKPVGMTAERMLEAGFLDRDRSKRDAYTVVKSMADRFYRGYIDERLSTLDLDWNMLGDAMSVLKKSGETKDKRELDNLKKSFKDSISKHIFTKKDDEDIFSAKVLAKLRGTESDYEEIEALKKFDRFAGYFQDFFVNRRVFADTVRGSCAYRIVEDNFPRHFENCRKYQIIRRDNPELILELKRSMEGYLETDPDVLFSIGHFGKLLRQKDIDAYNRVVGSVFRSESDNCRGFNPILNEFHQKNPDSPKMLMQKLQKQILSEPDSGSFRLRNYENEGQMFEDLQNLWTGIETNRLLEIPASVLEEGEFDRTGVFISKAGVNTLSSWMFSDWERIGGLLQIFKFNEMGDSASKSRKKIDKWLDSDSFSLDVLDRAVANETDIGIVPFLNRRLIDAAEQAREAYLGLEGCASMRKGQYQGRVKTFVDSLLRYRDVLKLFSYDPDLPLDRRFYDTFQFVYEEMASAYRTYNRCRSFITKKEYNTEKFKMNFDCPHLADGWDLNKESSYNSFLFRRDGLYYLGIRNPAWKYEDFSVKADPECDDFYEKAVYKQLQDPVKMLPKVFFSKKGLDKYKPSERILKGYESGLHKQGDSFDLGFCHDLIDFYKNAISQNRDWDFFDFRFRETSEYCSISEFYQDVESQGYRMRFVRIPAPTIDEMVNEGRLLLFQMYNKDYSRDKTPGGKPNLHTMYWEAAMSEDNLRDVRIKINGYAELFWRDASIKDGTVHRKGSVLVNRIGKDGKPIPSDAYYDLCRYCNGIRDDPGAGKGYEDQIVCKNSRYDIEKDRRYCHDRMFLHIPLTFNFKSDGKTDVNRKVLEWIRENEDIKFLGIDRGERNLIYLSLVDSDGRILWQRSMNTIVQKDGRGNTRALDYHEKLAVREEERRNAQQSWGPMDAIKNLKEGYVSAAVHEICRIAVEEKALIVIENLNYGFKNSRKKVEKQTYQTFERMLINKLQNLVFKDSEPGSPGSVLAPYQLCGPIDSMEDIPSHCGMLIHVTAAFTSRIDPVTGFVNVFNLSDITNNTQRADFLSRMTSIRYNSDEDVFEFSFDYGNFRTRLTPKVRKWTVCTYGDRYTYNRKDRTLVRISPTSMIKDALTKARISYEDGSDIMMDISESDAVRQVFEAFRAILDMRVTTREEDNIVSPVRDSFGRHFVSGTSGPELPQDADANGAYCIALKGLLLAKKIRTSDGDRLPLLNNNDWVEFMQTRVM